jgi:hypothetical protein
VAAAGLPQRDYHPKRGNRRLATGLTAGAASVALVLGLALSGVFGSASHQPSPPVHAQLAAWTVVKQADGTVLVKIREFRDPAGLQRKLRADGIPASVKFNPANLEGKGAWAIVHFKGNPCQEYSGGEGQAQNVVTGGSPFTVGMFVHPSAIPSGAGLQFVASRNVGTPRRPRRGIFSSGWSKPAHGAPVVEASADGGLRILCVSHCRNHHVPDPT